MLKRNFPVLIHAQGLHWTHQRLLGLASQLCMLAVAVIIVTSIIITLGERRLQEDWATQRYAELQAVGGLMADSISFQQFRTQMLAQSEVLDEYLVAPSANKQAYLKQKWQVMVNNVPALLGVALYNTKGQFVFATTDEFGQEPLPPSLLGNAKNIGKDEIYTSPLEFTPIEGVLEPYLYQLAWLTKDEHEIQGYLVTYNSVSKMVNSIKPAFSSQKAPLMMIDTQGLLYSGANKQPEISRFPRALGDSLKQSYPALWRKMAMSNFGQFHGEDATFVYLKIELVTQYETRREYFLLSYVRNSDIAAKFHQWRNILIIAAVLLTLLGALAIILTHLYHLVLRSRQFSLELSNQLFHADIGCMIVNDNGRVVTANEITAELLRQPMDDLADRSLQRILQLEDDHYAQMIESLTQHESWEGEIKIDPDGKQILVVKIHLKPNADKLYRYMIVTFEDISELKQYQQDVYLNQLITENSVPTVLSNANGTIIRANSAFDNMVNITDHNDQNLTQLLEKDLGKNWSQITQQIFTQGSWIGTIDGKENEQLEASTQATLKGYLDESGDIEYIVSTFERSLSQNNYLQEGDLIPHRSTILVSLRDLDDYFHNMSPLNKEFSSLLLLDITAESMLSHISDIAQIENRQREVESQLFRDLPHRYQIAKWQLGKLIIILPNTDADQAHYFALESLNKLQANGLGDGICIGIASYQEDQTLEQFLSNAEIALKRAKQTGEHNICQAFTRHDPLSISPPKKDR
ncbi:PAS domain-containing protein [uncultured Shewanella sp.]|uniref:PAS domain-containing protein n=1 Tax=uncultured Shewanella sp. TaxID=173975 RepID=UPI002632297A|nr:PAS domain-containing protein [uncultured Shewanella sp.]